MIYKIPLNERFTDVGDGGLSARSKCMHVDAVGLFVGYRKKSDLTVNNIRRHLIGRRSTHCVIKAKSPVEVLDKFYNECEGQKLVEIPVSQRLYGLIKKRKL